MAAKAGKSWKKGTSQFVRFELGKEHIALLKKAKADIPGMVAKMGELVSDGYSISYRWDSYSDSFACWIQPHSEDCENQGLILSGRGRTVEGAIAEALCKHHVLEGAWPVPEKRASMETWED